MNKQILLLVGVLIGTGIFLGCGSPAQETDADQSPPEVAQVTEESAYFNECPRAVPRRSLDPATFSNSDFELKDSIAIETVQVAPDVSLVIEHRGCSYFVQEYTFQISHADDMSNPSSQDAYALTLDYLGMIGDANISPINIQAGLQAIESLLTNETSSSLGTAIALPSDEIPETMTVEKVEAGQGVLEIVVLFSMGPL